MQHWILKLTIANSRGESSKMQKMEQRMATLENRLKNRSRSPRRQQNQRALPASQQMLALPASSSQPKGKAKGQKGKGKGKNKGGKTQSSNSSTFQGFRNFQALYKIGWSARKTLRKRHVLEISIQPLSGLRLYTQTCLRRLWKNSSL